jgi:hypothetical protein
VKIWFLRLSDDNTDTAALKKAKLAPILFRKIPLRKCSFQLNEQQIRDLVSLYYPEPENSAASRGQYAGALIRFLRQVQVGDFIAICLNRSSPLLYGEILEGNLVEFPGIPGSKARPLRWLRNQEIAKIEAAKLSPKATKYSGTICLWEDWDLPDEDEKKKETFYSKPQPGLRQVKFIRVGVDLGCGGRLSRLFPQNYYHFIPIPQHNDPEFCRFTYGDVDAAPKFRSLLSLRRDDILVFYAGLETEPGSPFRRLVGIVAYFVVREIYVIDRNPNKQLGVRAADHPRGIDFVARFGALADKASFQEMIVYCGDYNEHATACSTDALNLVVCGDGKRSRLLEKVEVLAEANSSGKYVLDPKTAGRWGLKPGADLTRCAVRTVDAKMVKTVTKRLFALA